jgi:hypothetical protein
MTVDALHGQAVLAQPHSARTPVTRLGRPPRQQRVRYGVGSIIDQDLNRPKRLFGSVEQARRQGRIPQVPRHEVRSPARRPDRIDDWPGRVGLHCQVIVLPKFIRGRTAERDGIIMKEDGSSLGCEGLGDGRTDPMWIVTAGDQGGLSAKLEVDGGGHALS